MRTPTAPALPPALTVLLAVSTGPAAAAIDCAQPMPGVPGAEIGATPAALGLVPMRKQLGYACGIALLAPLGDRYDRRRIILIKAACLAAALLLASAAPSIGVLLAASFVIGLSATLAQDIVPAAATLATEAQRGQVADRLANVRACVAEGERRLWDVYRGEHEAFKATALRRGLCDALGTEIDALLGDAQRPTDVH